MVFHETLWKVEWPEMQETFINKKKKTNKGPYKNEYVLSAVDVQN